MLTNPIINEQNFRFNCRTKFYLDHNGTKVPYQVMCFSAPIFNPFYSSDNLDRYDEVSEKKHREIFPDENKKRALRRAKSRVFDLMINNVADCNLFVTLTVDKEKIDRYDYSKIMKELNVFLGNKVQKNGLKYVLIPEYHKDGAIHFHGIFNRYKGIDLIDSGKKKNGKKIYNIGSYKFGFTTAQKISGKDSIVKVSKYVYKYMSKSASLDMIGGRYFLHGGALNEAVVEYSDTDFSTFPGSEFEITDTMRCKIISI